MKFKEFNRWCNERACDACWSMQNAIFCVGILENVKQYPFWKREKIWREKYKENVLNKIVNPTNELIEKYKKRSDKQ